MPQNSQRNWLRASPTPGIGSPLEQKVMVYDGLHIAVCGQQFGGHFISSGRKSEIDLNGIADEDDVSGIAAASECQLQQEGGDEEEHEKGHWRSAFPTAPSVLGRESSGKQDESCFADVVVFVGKLGTRICRC